MDQTLVTDHNSKLTLQLRVLTSKPLTSIEKEQFNRILEASLARTKGSLETQIVEIPTAAAAIKSRATADLPSCHLRSPNCKRICLKGSTARSPDYLPPPAQFVNYQLATRPSDGMDLTLSCLSDRDIEPDAQALIQQDVRNRLDYPEATVKLSRFPISLGQLLFRAGDSFVDRASQEMLDNAAGYLQQHRNLR